MAGRNIGGDQLTRIYMKNCHYVWNNDVPLVSDCGYSTHTHTTILQHPGFPGQSPESHKMVVVVV